MSDEPRLEFDLSGGHVVFTTRLGGVSEGPFESLNLGIATNDDDARVRANRRRVADRIGLSPRDVVMSRQVHGADIREWPHGWRDGGDFVSPQPLAEADGHTTVASRVALLVQVADCLPVALVSQRRVAMLHCGWRGLAAGIVEAALERFQEPPAAAIGPGIGGCCYEVGPEVLSAFADVEGAANGRMLDLKAVARTKLERAGAASVEDVGLCTSCRADLFFSHRRDSGATGRQAGLAWLD